MWSGALLCGPDFFTCAQGIAAQPTARPREMFSWGSRFTFASMPGVSTDSQGQSKRAGFSSRS